jgi:hypothetical protein
MVLLILISEDNSLIGPYYGFNDESVTENSDCDHNTTNILETPTAEYRSALHGKKWDGGLGAAFCAENLSFATIAVNLGHPFRLAFLTVFWVVNEIFLPKKHLLARGKDELLRAFDTE